ncbi:MAG: alpha/beta hydrolase [Cytophagaceae bacterium]|nr:MAG: alpha/beta hydrolase [Cytophagaceae bacterium]
MSCAGLLNAVKLSRKHLPLRIPLIMIAMHKTWLRTITLLLAVSSPLCSQAGAATATEAEFGKPQKLVDVGGRKLNLYCSGLVTTTVIFDSPSGDGGWSWYKVQPEVARRTRACVYDRAGFGFSDPAARQDTPANAVEDLHKALAVADIKPPYLLVGNSLGGGNAQVYAYRFPEQVKGLVLVEPQTEDQTARLNKVTGGKLDQVYAIAEQTNAYCLSEARKGLKQGDEALNNCVGDQVASFGPVLGKVVQAIKMKPSYWRTVVGEYKVSDAIDVQLRALRRPFGDIPLVVLTRGVSPYAIPGQPQSALNKAIEDENEKIHREIAALSSRGKQQVVPGAAHLIQAQRPDAIVQAVLEVLAQICMSALGADVPAHMASNLFADVSITRANFKKTNASCNGSRLKTTMLAFDAVLGAN